MRLFFALLFSPLGLLAQTAPPPYVVGHALDDSTGQGVDNATVTNPRTKQMSRTNRHGAFYLLVKPGDSIVVSSLTHGRRGIKWDGVTRDPILRMHRVLPDEVAIELPGVTVRGKREEQIRKELQQLLSEPEAKRGLTSDQVLDLAMSPITLLYEAFSKQAKSRRKAAVLSQQYRRHRLADYRLDLTIEQATPLRGEEAERFKKYLNFSDEHVLLASEYELTFDVLRLYEMFKK